MQAIAGPLDMYVRRVEDCFKIEAGHGESVREFWGMKDGNTQQSVAWVEIEKQGYSLDHHHPEKEESYLVQEGQGRLTVGKETRRVTPGDVIKIPVGTTHQIFNEHAETLKFFCICASAWTVEGFIPGSNPKEKDSGPLYVRRKEVCQENATGTGALEYELLKSKHHRVAQVEIVKEGCFSHPLHPEEESYLILAGEGRLEIGDKTRVVKPGDVANIPVGKTHKIFNDQVETLKMYVVSAPVTE